MVGLPNLLKTPIFAKTCFGKCFGLKLFIKIIYSFLKRKLKMGRATFFVKKVFLKNASGPGKWRIIESYLCNISKILCEPLEREREQGEVIVVGC